MEQHRWMPPAVVATSSWRAFWQGGFDEICVEFCLYTVYVYTYAYTQANGKATYSSICICIYIYMYICIYIYTYMCTYIHEHFHGWLLIWQLFVCSDASLALGLRVYQYYLHPASNSINATCIAALG